MQVDYLRQIPRKQALDLFLSKVTLERKCETIPVSKAKGRVTSHPVTARRSYPNYEVAAMDGIAVQAAKTFSASDQSPLCLKEGEFLPIDTGEPLPQGYDAVIMVEDLQFPSKETVEIIAPATPWQNVRPVGEDMAAGEMLASSNHKLTPVDLGALLAGGVTEISVLAHPRVAFIPTGTEIVSPDKDLEIGEIPEFNSTIVGGFLEDWGATAEIQPIVADDLHLLIEALIQCLKWADMVIMSAGSSAGQKDYTARAIESVGEILVHGVATRPGKPVILGRCGNTPIIGLPGYPVSAYLNLEWFVRPMLYRYMSLREPERQTTRALCGRRIISHPGVEEFVRVNAGFVDGHYVVNPLERGAGITMSLARASGLLVIPPDYTGIEQGEEVTVELFCHETDLKGTILVTGSHDLTLDTLRDCLRQEHQDIYLSSSHVGSMAGLTAIREGRTHMAGIHLLDQLSGEYNIPFIKRFFPDQRLVLVNLAYRLQGWILAAGNPLGIKNLDDVIKEQARFVNRQRGAGTRLLFDYLLAQSELLPEQIYGYEREEYTHLSVAAAVEAGTADIGMGIYAATRTYEVDFLPIGEERYDLLMTEDFYNSNTGRLVFEVIRSPEFQNKILLLGGYDLRDSGKVVYQQ